jgi:glycosyltransferase involved in cell wall biosynthesis
MNRHGDPGGGVRLSIALCTYNGGRFLAEQLESFRSQTRLPDELVVCDDNSHDDTRDVVERFATTVSFPVRLERNEPQLGHAANFGKAMGLCDGDWILPCDQDDVWLPHKLATLEAVIMSRPDLGLVFSDAEIVGQDGQPLGYRFSQVHRLDARKRRQINGPRPWRPFLRQFIAQGTALAFAAALRDVILPIPSTLISHDYWIGITAPALRPVHFVADPLLLYRQHSAQLTASRKQSTAEIGAKAIRGDNDLLRNTARRYAVALDRLMGPGVPLLDPGIPLEYAEKIAHCLARCRIKDARLARLPLALREVLSTRYFRYSSSWRCIGSDLLALGGS